MRINRIAVGFVILFANLLAATTVNATLIPNPDGQRVYDTTMKVTWAANANLAGTRIFIAGPGGQLFDGTLGFPICDKDVLVPCVDADGAMSYDTVGLWLQTLNGLYGDGYLGHHNWTIPRVPLTDNSCTVRNWGYNCEHSALGSLYYRSLPSGGGNSGFTYPDTTVPVPDQNPLGPFRNFQPYLYWTSTGGNGAGNASGQTTFSFNTGWQGSNHKFHYMYALPMIPGRVDRQGISYIQIGSSNLSVSSDGEMVWDKDAVEPGSGQNGVTWLADADLARTHKFGLAKCESHHRLCINADGSMKYGTAVKWLANMNSYKNGLNEMPGWLGVSGWILPSADPNGSCDSPTLHCDAGPMGHLYFDELEPRQGTSVFQLTPANFVGPFSNLQPYLYWACAGPDPCQNADTSPSNSNQSWSFSFGNGFQGTDIKKNNLYVMVYYPQTPAEALNEGIKDELHDYPFIRSRLLTEAAQISSTITLEDMLAALNLFESDVNAQRSTKLTSAEADYLIALAAATADARGLKPVHTPPCAPHCI
jgi:hypothetical protein